MCNPLQNAIPLILVVDDDRTIRDLLSRAMEREGYRVAAARNGQEALDLFRELQPDMVLLDGVMPVMDGITCCQRLRMFPQGDRIPILIITGLEDQASVDQAFNAGANDYITKPIHFPVLCQRVRRVLHASWALEELRQQTEREKLLRTITQKIFQQSLNQDQILNTTVAEVRQFMQVDRVVIYHFGFSGDGLVVAEAVGSSWAALRGEIVHRHWFERQLGRYRQGAPWAVADFHPLDLPAELQQFLHQYQVEAALEIPILQHDQLWGLIAVHQCSQSRTWLASEIDALTQLSTQVAIALRQSQLYEQISRLAQDLQRRAELDGLTQVANRRHFDRYANQEWQVALQNQTPLALILCDVDFFKAYNDYYGHLEGDRCLQKIATAIGNAVQQAMFLVARYGGEEFAVILPNATVEVAMQIAQDVRIKIRDLKLRHEASLIYPCVTLSLGVASLIPTLETSVSDLIDAADKALYQAKREGRDRVVPHKPATAKPFLRS